VLVDLHAVDSDCVREIDATAVALDVPRLEPTTVTLNAAVTAMFVGNADDGYGPSNVTAPTKLPTDWPVVTATERPGSTPEATLARIADEDVHAVVSDRLACNRITAETSDDGTMCPITVTD
jgi:hypothetical protein